jgi:hypothetical protein
VRSIGRSTHMLAIQKLHYRGSCLNQIVVWRFEQRIRQTRVFQDDGLPDQAQQ